jgi:hypothetical protein
MGGMIFLSYRPQVRDQHAVRIAVDTTGIARPKGVTSRDRSIQPVPPLGEGEQALTSGRDFSAVAVLPERPSSWTYILSQQRVETATTAQQTAFAQLSQLVPHLPGQSVILLDRGYDLAWRWCKLSTLPRFE